MTITMPTLCIMYVTFIPFIITNMVKSLECWRGHDMVRNDSFSVPIDQHNWTTYTYGHSILRNDCPLVGWDIAKVTTGRYVC